MKAGTIIKMEDGRIGTIVYNGLDGEGVKWGRHDVSGLVGCGNLLPCDVPVGYELYPDAMLRNPYPGADLPCVGREYDVISGYRTPDA